MPITLPEGVKTVKSLIYILFWYFILRELLLKLSKCIYHKHIFKVALSFAHMINKNIDYYSTYVKKYCLEIFFFWRFLQFSIIKNSTLCVYMYANSSVRSPVDAILWLSSYNKKLSTLVLSAEDYSQDHCIIPCQAFCSYLTVLLTHADL